MTLAWPATSWVYWFGVALVTAALLSIIIRRRRRGMSNGRPAVALAAFIAAAGAVAVLPGILVPQSPGAPTAIAAIAWTGTAVVLGAVGLVIGAWAIAGDPARGRRRCPRCWYDMAGIAKGTRGYTCPECGRTARADRRLLRTRRSRWHIALAVATLATALASIAVPPLLDGTWVKYPPNTAYVIAMPWLDPSGRPAEEWSLRFGNGIGPEWQTGWRSRLLRSRALAAMDPGNDAMTIRFGLRALTFMDDKPASLIEALAPFVRHTDQYVRWNALDLLARVPAEHERRLDILAEQLDDPRSNNRLAAADVLGAFGVTQNPRIDPPPSLVRAAASDPDLKLRRLALWSLQGFRPTPESLGVLAGALDDADRGVRRNALCVLAEIEPDAHRLDTLLLRMMNDSEPWIRTNALQIIAKRGPYTDDTAAAFLRLSTIASVQHGNVSGAFSNLAGSRAPSEWLLPLLLRALDDPRLCSYAADALAHLGPRARPLLSQMRELRDTWQAAQTPAPCLLWLMGAIENIQQDP